jgi:mitochondrial import receptor subunit TOM40
MLQIEHDYQGTDYNLNAKVVNISPTDFTGVYIGSYLQSFTKNIALGIEGYYQRPTPDMAELSTSYLAKYTSNNNNWIATAQLQPSGILQATYWQKLSEKVEVAADLQVIAAPTRRDAIATLGAKYDLRMSTFRAQVDSSGKVSALLEQRFAPTLAFLLSGEIDHFNVRVPLIPCVLFLIPSLPEHSKGWSGRDDRELEFDTRGDGLATSTIVNSYL